MAYFNIFYPCIIQSRNQWESGVGESGGQTLIIITSILGWGRNDLHLINVSDQTVCAERSSITWLLAFFLFYLTLYPGNDNILYPVKNANKGNLIVFLYTIRQMDMIGGGI